MSGYYDLVIRNGKVIDGTGDPYVLCDIAVKDGNIADIGNIIKKETKEIDAEGHFVVPGFIDLHNHLDQGILQFPRAESHIMQGVTSAVVGNCGMSMAPCETSTLELLKNYNEPFLPSMSNYQWDWTDLSDFLKKVEEQNITVNLIPLVGHGTLRIAVKGFSNEALDAEEMERMKELLRKCLEDGAWGLSSGLIYPPGTYADENELIEITKVLSEYGGIYTSHIRNEGGFLIESVKEAIRIGEENGIPVQISHHKALSSSNWGKVEQTLLLVKEARERGVDVAVDVYPYTAVSTTITSLLPSWALEGGIAAMLGRLEDPAARDQIFRTVKEPPGRGESLLKDVKWENIKICECAAKPEYEGLTLHEICGTNSFGKESLERFLDLLSEIRGNATMAVFAMDESDVETVIASPFSSIISDAWVTSPDAGGKPHPRAYGTFPRVFSKYVRERKILSIEEAVKKMTSMPAERIGLSDRGILKTGFKADIVIFNGEEINDRATFRDPHQYPEGIKYVIIDGKIVVEDGVFSGVRPGIVLKRENVSEINPDNPVNLNI